MILHVTDVRHLGGYRLHLVFDNGDEGEADLRERLHGEIFEPLKDESLFSTAGVHPIFRTVTWANGADLAPEYLLDLVHSQRRRAA